MLPRVPSLDFWPHIDFCICKTIRVLGFIRHHSKNFDFPKCFSSLYSSLVRTLLEYGDGVWSLYTLRDIQHHDKVQNHFLNFASYRINISHSSHDYIHIVICLVLNCYSNVVIYPVVVLLMSLLKEILMQSVR